MNTAPQITFRNMESSEPLRELVRERISRLEELGGRLERCHVTIEAPPRHHVHGSHFRVRVDLHVPGHHLSIGHDPADDATHEDAYAAVGHAFDVARRRILSTLGRARAHEHPQGQDEA